MSKHKPMNECELWEQESDLNVVLSRIRSEDAPPESLQRSLKNASRLAYSESGQLAVPPISGLDTKSGFILRLSSLSVNYRLVITAAAALLIVVTLALMSVSQQSAWAQVVATFDGHPWVRLTLQDPQADAGNPAEPRAVIIWFSGDRSLAAIQSPHQTAWVDIAKGEQFELMTDAKQILLSQLAAIESREINYFLESLAPFELALRSSEDIGVSAKLTGQSLVTENGVNYSDFNFTVHSASDPQPPKSVTVRVEQESMSPVQLRIARAVFKIDYPENGPTDIYRLGIPIDTPVIDLRSLWKYFHDRELGTHDDYEASELVVLAGQEGRWINEAQLYRVNGGAAQYAYAKPEQVHELASTVYFGGSDSPTGTAHALEWWHNEVAKLDYVEQEWSEHNFPHTRCYSPIGSVHSYSSVLPSQVAGLEDTIELRGKTVSVWLDPGRDSVVRRIENVMDDGSIAVTQFDELLQDSQGHWFVTRWRNGRVSMRGGQLSEVIDRDDPGAVATTLHVASIKFK